MLSRAYGSVLKKKKETAPHSFNPGHRSPASWHLDMNVQNLCFDRLFNKKNGMKYFKNLIIVQMWATNIQLFAFAQC